MSITPSERKAIAFVVVLLALGAGARFLAALRQERVAIGAQHNDALAAQLAAVDSQRMQQRLERRRPRRAKPEKEKTKSAEQRDTVIVDVDRASASELEALPRIGPTLAKRIVNEREANGAFGSISGLLRVKGVGPKLVTHIAPYVTFSASVRPSTALSVSLGSVPRASRPPPTRLAPP
ncbi:MAG TPA: helix-hairpin-helix domain-containing protein [Gemmatimonadaceae bacterium]|nr:helix-hairpin-helix domain-containing protein [Gemmatimonadaceae bacterium]